MMLFPRLFRPMCRAALAALALVFLSPDPASAVTPPEWAPPVPVNSSFATNSGDDSWPAVATDGLGNWYAVWFSTHHAGERTGTDPDIVCARSTDDGVSWTSATLVNSDGTTDSFVDWVPRVVAGGGGEVVAAWVKTGPEGKNAIYAARSGDYGQTWSAPSLLAGASEAIYDGSLDLRRDETGTVAVVWVALRQPGVPRRVLIRRSTDGGQAWLPQQLLAEEENAGYNSPANARLAAHGAGRWSLLWFSRELGGEVTTGTSHVVAIRSQDGGVSWSAPARLGVAGGSTYQGYPQVTADASGHAMVLWQRSTCDFTSQPCETWTVMSRSTDAGSTWTEPVRLPWAISQTATDGAGNWIGAGPGRKTVLLPNGSEGQQDWVITTRSTDGGESWTTPTYLAQGSFFLEADLAAAPGHALLLHVTKEYGGDGDLVAYHSTHLGDSWSTQGVVNAYAVIDSGHCTAPNIATDRQGRWMAVWSSTHNPGTAGYGNKGFFSRSQDNGRTWAAQGLFPGVNASVASDGQGEWLAFPDGRVTRSAAGGTTWPAPAPLGDAMSLVPATDGQGRWVLAGQTTTFGGNGSGAGDRDVVFFSSSDNGSNWSAASPLNPDALTDAAASADFFPQVATDGLGTWMATWRFHEQGTTAYEGEVALRRSTDNGLTWGAVMVPHGNTRGGDNPARIATDGRGTWVMLWSQYSPPGTYLSRSTDNGVTWSPPQPLPVDHYGDLTVREPVLATDGKGAWAAVFPALNDTGWVCWSVDHAGTWSKAVPFPFGSSTHLLSDGNGGWLAAGVKGGDIYASWTTSPFRAPNAAQAEWSLYE